MSLPDAVARLVMAAAGAPPERHEPVSGGCINSAARVETARGPVFVKWKRGAPPGFFAAEADGLARLAATKTVRVPEVLAVDDDSECPGIVMRWIPPGDGAAGMEDAGRRLAELHGLRGRAPGLERDNVIGALPQANAALPGETWGSFFRRQRVEALAHVLPARVRRKVDGFCFEQWVFDPEGGCALLHGDLWSGNLVCDQGGGGWLVDPAVYAGHPEVDLAMTRLFGGFRPTFYAAYQEVAGRFDPGLSERLEILNLYPLLVHVHLFGGGYVAQVEAILDRYGAS